MPLQNAPKREGTGKSSLIKTLADSTKVRFQNGETRPDAIAEFVLKRRDLRWKALGRHKSLWKNLTPS